MNKKKFLWIDLPKSHNKTKLTNPYCGFYSLYRFFAEDTVNQDNIELSRFKTDKNFLCLIEINLVNFNNKDLPDEVLENIQRIFECFIIKGKQLIVRFLYDWEGKGIIYEPKDFSLILAHIEKLSLLLKLYEKDIYILQGLFIGNWGEMHGSRYLTSYHLTTLARAVYNSTGNTTQIALRSPSFIRSLFKSSKPISWEESFSSLIKARFSLFNDGIMGSETDLGTYGYVMEKNFTNYSDKWIKEDELKYQNNLCKYVSNGGEAVKGPEKQDGKTTVETFKKMRLSYLNDGHDLELLQEWKSHILDSSFKEYRGVSLYEYIENHLGYRYELADVQVKKNPEKRQGFLVNLRIINKGFSPSYNKFKVSLIIRDEDLNEIIEEEIMTDTRYWLPDDLIKISGEINIRQLENKVYSVDFRIYDQRSKRFIELYSPFSKMDFKGCYNIGRVRIKGH